LHPGGEFRVDELAEVLDQKVRDDLADRLGVETTLLERDVATIEDGADRRRVGRWSTDPELLERLDQRCLGEARWRLGEVLGRRDVLDARGLALAQRRKLALGLFGVIIAAFG